MILKKLLRDFDRVILVIGSSDLKDKDNPFSARARKKMIQAVLDPEKIPSKKCAFAFLPYAPDHSWVSVFLARVPRKSFDAVFTNNPRVKKQLKRFGIPFVSSAMKNRSQLSGKKIRKFPKDWKTRVPRPVVNFLRKL